MKQIEIEEKKKNGEKIKKKREESRKRNGKKGINRK